MDDPSSKNEWKNQEDKKNPENIGSLNILQKKKPNPV